MKRHLLSLLLACALSAGLLTGCGSNAPESPVAPPPPQSESSTPSTPAPPPPDSESADIKEVPLPAPSGDADTQMPAVEEPIPPSPAPAPSMDPALAQAESLLNQASLSPMRTNDAVLDTMVTKILSQITTEDMSTFEKVLACYDYLKENTVYNHQDEATLLFGDIYTSREDYKLVSLSREILGTGLGVCDHYAAAFQVLTRRIGLESYICTGKHLSQKGGMGGHVWNIITLDGKDYVFDAQIDDSGSGSYNRFCKTFEELGSKYQDYNPAQNKADFCRFQRVSPPGYYPDLATYLPEFLSSEPQLTENLSQSTDYSNIISAEATKLRKEAGLSPMYTEPGAIRTASFCALSAAFGEEVTMEIAAHTMLAEDISFQYVVVIPLGSCDDPVQLVHDETDAFINPNFTGFAAGVYDDQWTLLLYGG